MVRMKKIKSKKSKDKILAVAPGQTLGYSLQFTRLTAMLFDAADGSACSLEVLDDVAEVTAAGETTLVQSKSALTNNPVANRSVSLWKCLFNWLQNVEAFKIDPSKTVFELYVSRQVNGEWVSAFHQAKTDSEAKSALDVAKLELWGNAPSFSKRKDLAEEIKYYVDYVFQAADQQKIQRIVKNMRLVCGSGSPQSDLEQIISRHPVSPSRVFDIADKMCGWVKRESDKLLEKGLPAVLQRDLFHSEYTSYVRRVDREIILKSFGSKPSQKEIEGRLPDKFVRQLELIDLEYDELLEAVSDFLQAAGDRVYWSKSGEVHESSFVELDENLCRSWRNLNRAVQVERRASTEINRGQLLHSSCMLHTARVQGMEPPSHFIPGCFHGLADGLIIGWHPSYKSLLESVEVDIL